MEQISPELEGRGGGFGKNPGHTIAEIQALFDKCLSDVSMRSISVVLRITREQLESRGQLGLEPVLAMSACVCAVLFGGLRYFGPESLSAIATKAFLGAVSVSVILFLVSVSSSRARKTNLAQQRVIREMAVRTLTALLDQQPKLKPLTLEQSILVKSLIRLGAHAEKLKALLAITE